MQEDCGSRGIGPIGARWGALVRKGTDMAKRQRKLTGTPDEAILQVADELKKLEELLLGLNSLVFAIIAANPVLISGEVAAA